MAKQTDVDWGGLDVIVNSVKVGATKPGQAGTEISSTEIGFVNGVTAGTAAADKALVADANVQVSGLNALSGSITTTKAPFVPVLVQQAINANGAINITTFYTALTSVGTTGVTFTLADSTQVGHLKKIKMIVDDGDATVTFNTNATIVFADVGDYALLVWNGSDWIPIELGNDADGATAPAYTPAS